MRCENATVIADRFASTGGKEYFHKILYSSKLQIILTVRSEMTSQRECAIMHK